MQIQRHLSDLPVMLSIAGHDPSGGAGIQADLESAAALGVQGLSLISCLTVQDSGNVRRLQPVDSDLIGEQLDCLIEDIPIDALKLGLLGSQETLELIAQRITDGHLPHPVVDPVLAAGGGLSLTGERLIEALRQRLLPLTRLLTPNLPEAQQLSGQQSLADAAAALCQSGCQQVLITGGHNDEASLINRLYDANGLVQEWNWPRLPGRYHGTGCTLSSAIAALLGKGIEPITALQQAQEFTWQSLAEARRIGHHQLTPARHAP